VSTLHHSTNNFLACFARLRGSVAERFRDGKGTQQKGQVEPGGDGTGSLKRQIRLGLQWLDDKLNPTRRIQQRASNIVKALRQENCQALLACSGDLLDMPAAFLAAQRLGIPFYAYMFDDYATHCVPTVQRRYTWSLTPFLVQHAAGIAVPNQFLSDIYQRRYGIAPIIIPNPVDVADTPPAPPVLGRPVRLVYTGMIYDAQLDALLSILAALRNWNGPPVELHVYSPTDRRMLAAQGIREPAILHAPVSLAESIHLQQTADILLLPLAFRSSIPEVINTSSPGKMGELLASGRPVLVHAPAESYVSWYVRTHRCGAVADSQDTSLVRHTLSRLIGDERWRQELVRRAWMQARRDFASSVAQERFRLLFAGGCTVREAA
jgi:hypothetical protein